MVTRIWHKLDDLDYKIITQQYVKRPGSDYALTDMYFPQPGMHIAVDEGHHKSSVISDKGREQDIISITGHIIRRIDVTTGISDVNKQIDTIVDEIRMKRASLEDGFVVWDPIKEISYIDIKDNVAFKKIVDGINCFGVKYKGFQGGGVRHPIDNSIFLWFPKLYPNNKWINSISEDEDIIYEKSNIPEKVESHIAEVMKAQHKRIVFARVIDSLGEIKYRFKGIYELNIDKTLEEHQVIWERTGTRVKTYRPQKRT